MKKLTAILLTLCMALVACTGCSGSGSTTTTTQPTTTVATEPSTEDIFVQEFCESSGLSEETARGIHSLFTEQMHFDEIVFIEQQESGAGAWDIEADSWEITVMADNDGIYTAFTKGTVITIYGGDTLLTKEDLALRDTSEYELNYILIARQIIEGVLEDPSSVSFQPTWDAKIQRNDDLIIFDGYVETDDGAQHTFTVQFRVLDIENYLYETLYIEIAGQTSGELIPLD